MQQINTPRFHYYLLGLGVAGHYADGGDREDEGDDDEDSEGAHGEARDLVRHGDQGAAVAAGGARVAAEPQAREEAPHHRQDQVHGGDDRNGSRRDAPPRGPQRHARGRSVGVGHGGERKP